MLGLPAQQPSTTPARALFGSSGANTAAPGSSAAKAGPRYSAKAPATNQRNAAGAAAGQPQSKPVAGGQTTLNAYFPVVDGSSRDSDVSHGAGGQAPVQAGTRPPVASPVQTIPVSSTAHLQGRLAQQSSGAYAADAAPANTPSRSRAVAPGAAAAAGAVPAALRHAHSAPLVAIPESAILHPPEQSRLDEVTAQVSKLIKLFAISYGHVCSARRTRVRYVCSCYVCSLQARYLAEQLSVKDRQLAELQQQLRCDLARAHTHTHMPMNTCFVLI